MREISARLPSTVSDRIDYAYVSNVFLSFPVALFLLRYWLVVNERFDAGGLKSQTRACRVRGKPVSLQPARAQMIFKGGGMMFHLRRLVASDHREQGHPSVSRTPHVREESTVGTKAKKILVLRTAFSRSSFAGGIITCMRS